MLLITWNDCSIFWTYTLINDSVLVSNKVECLVYSELVGHSSKEKKTIHYFHGFSTNNNLHADVLPVLWLGLILGMCIKILLSSKVMTRAAIIWNCMWNVDTIEL